MTLPSIRCEDSNAANEANCQFLLPNENFPNISGEVPDESLSVEKQHDWLWRLRPIVVPFAIVISKSIAQQCFDLALKPIRKLAWFRSQ